MIFVHVCGGINWASCSGEAESDFRNRHELQATGKVTSIPLVILNVIVVLFGSTDRLSMSIYSYLTMKIYTDVGKLDLFDALSKLP